VPTISLGRDCTISVGGSQLTSVRSVTVSFQRAEIECPMYYSGEVLCFPGNRTLSVEIECIGEEDADLLTDAMNNVQTPVTISGPHVSADFHVFSLSASEPLDDVVTFTATLKRSEQ
jgi:hypothetical protein